jgi:hypothetical protein
MPLARLVTLAHTAEAAKAQALYLAWSTLAWRGDLDLPVLLYTDDPAYFAPLAGAVELRVLSRQEIVAWRGPHDFTHRVKAAMLGEVIRRHPAEPFLYLDGDTYWKGPPGPVLQRIGPGRAVMHAREDHVGSHPGYHMRHFSGRLRRLRFRGGPIDLDRWMWNAGAIGVHPADFQAVADWLEFIDEVYPRYPRGLVEQYSIGMFLQQRGALAACDDLVAHYWPQKADFTAAILAELGRLRALPPGDALARLREHPLDVPFRAPVLRGTPLFRRLRRSLLGEH